MTSLAAEDIIVILFSTTYKSTVPVLSKACWYIWSQYKVFEDAKTLTQSDVGDGLTTRGIKLIGFATTVANTVLYLQYGPVYSTSTNSAAMAEVTTM